LRQNVYYALTFLVWALAIALWIAIGFPYLFFAILTAHIVELVLFGFKAGRQNGVNAARTIFLCLLYGFLWWLPLRRQMSAKAISKL